ncbi:MAG: hypothetical protein JNK27_11995 [Chitinophagaceae bacterium]|nr:hypothetical protein [Chitinophagaceae bacterium]
MNKKFLLSVITLILSVLAFSQNFVSLYEGCNYTGRKYILEPGSYRLYQMKIGNDKLSSMQIPSGLKVTIYTDDGFNGKSNTYSADVNCLDAEWRQAASSIVVEYLYGQPNYGQNDFVTFYNDCYSKGFSQTLRPGSYNGSQLGNLKRNISSFTINGNLKVKVYVNNEYLSGASATFEASQSCLSSSYNDKIASLVIEYKPVLPGNTPGSKGNYATLYEECNYEGNALRLLPGYYDGNKLGLMKFNIESIELPQSLRARVYIDNENLSGYSYTITSSSNCLSSNYRNRIGALIIEETGSYNPNIPGGNEERIVLYADEDYQGQSVSLLPGTYYSMAQAGFTNNTLSSLRIPVGYRVVLYEEENFKGRSYTLTASRSGLNLPGWNDRASSIAIYKD